jgi:hypothetical protein
MSILGIHLVKTKAWKTLCILLGLSVRTTLIDPVRLLVYTVLYWLSGDSQYAHHIRFRAVSRF